MTRQFPSTRRAASSVFTGSFLGRRGYRIAAILRTELRAPVWRLRSHAGCAPDGGLRGTGDRLRRRPDASQFGAPVHPRHLGDRNATIKVLLRARTPAR